MPDELPDKPRDASSIPCCVEASDAFLPRAQYALKMLLMPLGINPRWVSREALSGAGIYYGPAAQTLPESIARFPLLASTEAFFSEMTPYAAPRAQWRAHEGERYPVLFGGSTEGEDDLIASAFFWLAGWQEHTIRQRDEHGRFPFSASLQATLGTAIQPAADLYREVLARRLEKAGIRVARRTWGERQWAFCPTHDIDYLLKWRPGMVYRELVEYFAANRRKVSGGARFRRLKAFGADFIAPGDAFRKAFDRMIREVDARGGRATYFLKTGAHGPNDVYYRTGNPYLCKKVKQLGSLGFEVGLHPSYYAHDHAGYLRQETDRLTGLCGQPPVSVRQHYLRYSIDLTPRLHRAMGFWIDSSMAFADHEGFRRGTCHPYQIFDLRTNEPLDVWEMPLAIMDGTLFNYRNMDEEMAGATARDIMATCKRFGGVCVALWHNTLWDEMDFPGWGAHFLESLDYAQQEEARIDSLRSALNAYLGGLR